MKDASREIIITVDSENYVPIGYYKCLSDVKLNLVLYKRNSPFDISNQTIRFGCVDSKGNVQELINTSDKTYITISSNKVVIDLPNSCLSVPGKVECELEIIDKNGTMTTASFYFLVAKKVITDEAVEACSQFTTLQNLIKQCNEFLQGGVSEETVKQYIKDLITSGEIEIGGGSTTGGSFEVFNITEQEGYSAGQNVGPLIDNIMKNNKGGIIFFPPISSNYFIDSTVTKNVGSSYQKEWIVLGCGAAGTIKINSYVAGSQFGWTGIMHFRNLIVDGMTKDDGITVTKELNSHWTYAAGSMQYCTLKNFNGNLFLGRSGKIDIRNNVFDCIMDHAIYFRNNSETRDTHNQEIVIENNIFKGANDYTYYYGAAPSNARHCIKVVGDLFHLVIKNNRFLGNHGDILFACGDSTSKIGPRNVDILDNTFYTGYDSVHFEEVAETTMKVNIKRNTFRSCKELDFGTGNYNINGFIYMKAAFSSEYINVEGNEFYQHGGASAIGMERAETPNTRVINIRYNKLYNCKFDMRFYTGEVAYNEFIGEKAGAGGINSATTAGYSFHDNYFKGCSNALGINFTYGVDYIVDSCRFVNCTAANQCGSAYPLGGIWLNCNFLNCTEMFNVSSNTSKTNTTKNFEIINCYMYNTPYSTVEAANTVATKKAKLCGASSGGSTGGDSGDTGDTGSEVEHTGVNLLTGAKWYDGYLISTEDASVTENSGNSYTGMIAVKANDTLRVSFGLNQTDGQFCRLNFYTADGTFISGQLVVVRYAQYNETYVDVTVPSNAVAMTACLATSKKSTAYVYGTQTTGITLPSDIKPAGSSGLGDDLLTGAKWYDGYLVSETDASVIEASANSYTGMIGVTAGDTLTITFGTEQTEGQFYRLIYFKSNGTFVSGKLGTVRYGQYNETQVTETVPAGVNAMTVCINTSLKTVAHIYGTRTSTTLPADLEHPTPTVITNLLTGATWTDSLLIDVADGSNKTLSGNSTTTNYITISPNKAYTVSFGDNADGSITEAQFVRINYYTSSNTWISGQLTTVNYNAATTTRLLDTSPSNAAKCRISVSTTVKSKAMLYIEG